MMIKFEPIGQIRNNYTDNAPDQPLESDRGHYLEINQEFEPALVHLEEFSYIYVLFYLNQIKKSSELKLTLPREKNKEIGLFATRTPERPNPIGLSIVKLLKVKKNRLYISGIDALDGTPVLDIKPYIRELDLKEDANNGWLEEEELPQNSVYLYTDGACSGNPGPGGYAAVIVRGNNELEITGYEPETTNNRMELLAVIEGLKEIDKHSHVKLVSDSNYVLQGLNTWLKGWKRKGWKTSNNRPVKNKDLWQELDRLIRDYQIEFIKIKGHSGHEYNERVDTLAREQIEIHK